MEKITDLGYTGMTFFDYMMRFLKKDAPSGDLARDMNDTANFPAGNTKAEIKNYLRNMGACRDCLKTFERCYRQYEQYMLRHQYDKSE